MSDNKNKVFLVSIFNGLTGEFGAPVPIGEMVDARLEFARFLTRADIQPFVARFSLFVYGEFDLVSGILTRYDDYNIVSHEDPQVREFVEQLMSFQATRGAAVGGVNPPQVAARPEAEFDC